MKRILVIIILLGFVQAAWSQNLQHGSGGWYTYVGNYRLNGDWGLHFDSQIRLKNLTGAMQQWKNRVAINHQIRSNRTASAGYAFAILGGEKRRYEHRIYQQWIRRAPLGKADVAHRLRLEERWIDSAFQLRTRYSVRATHKLNQKGNWYMAMGNEYHFRLSEGKTDQNRANFGIGHKVGPKLSLETTYINQWIPGKTQNQMNHVVQLSVLTHLTLDWD
ncbi:MAG TPA: DUF2490 domain-containing protein [Rhodothermales bacterium]|nr:DUF2490 domain-containing protein [Rhodothermales bacterium]HRR07821.1 DUF2490 domain-containing protein [Rhodothermales bacterium]